MYPIDPSRSATWTKLGRKARICYYLAELQYIGHKILVACKEYLVRCATEIYGLYPQLGFDYGWQSLLSIPLNATRVAECLSGELRIRHPRLGPSSRPIIA